MKFNIKHTQVEAIQYKDNPEEICKFCGIAYPDTLKEENPILYGVTNDNETFTLIPEDYVIKIDDEYIMMEKETFETLFERSV